MTAIVEAIPSGTDVETAEAIRTGASVEGFQRPLGAFTILSGVRAARSA